MEKDENQDQDQREEKIIIHCDNILCGVSQQFKNGFLLLNNEKFEKFIEYNECQGNERDFINDFKQKGYQFIDFFSQFLTPGIIETNCSLNADPEDFDWEDVENMTLTGLGGGVTCIINQPLLQNTEDGISIYNIERKIKCLQLKCKTDFAQLGILDPDISEEELKKQENQIIGRKTFLCTPIQTECGFASNNQQLVNMLKKITDIQSNLPIFVHTSQQRNEKDLQITSPFRKQKPIKRLQSMEFQNEHWIPDGVQGEKLEKDYGEDIDFQRNQGQEEKQFMQLYLYTAYRNSKDNFEQNLTLKMQKGYGGLLSQFHKEKQTNDEKDQKEKDNHNIAEIFDKYGDIYFENQDVNFQTINDINSKDKQSQQQRLSLIKEQENKQEECQQEFNISKIENQRHLKKPPKQGMVTVYQQSDQYQQTIEQSELPKDLKQKKLITLKKLEVVVYQKETNISKADGDQDSVLSEENTNENKEEFRKIKEQNNTSSSNQQSPINIQISQKSSNQNQICSPLFNRSRTNSGLLLRRKLQPSRDNIQLNVDFIQSSNLDLNQNDFSKESQRQQTGSVSERPSSQINQWNSKKNDITFQNDYETYLAMRPPFWQHFAISSIGKFLSKTNHQFNNKIIFQNVSCAHSIGKIYSLKNRLKHFNELYCEVSVPYLIFDQENCKCDQRFKNDPPLSNQTNKKLLFLLIQKDYAIDLVSSYNFAVPTIYKSIEEKPQFKRTFNGFYSNGASFQAIWTLFLINILQQTSIHNKNSTIEDTIEYKNNKIKKGIKLICKLYCENPAKILNITQQKGSIKPGLDADFIIWNPQETVNFKPMGITPRNSDFKDFNLANEKIAPDLHIFYKRKLYGSINKTFIRGKLVYLKNGPNDFKISPNFKPKLIIPDKSLDNKIQ